MRRIQRDSSFEDVVKHFSTGENCLFKDMWRLLLFASTLGHQLGEKRSISKSDSGKAMPDSYFSNCPAWPGILYLFGICETESAEVLKADEDSEDLLIKCFEEYATHGLSVLKEASSRFDSPLDAVLDLIITNISSDNRGSKPIDFGGLI